MSHPLLFRLLLILSVLCNGLATAHAAVLHAMMAVPVQKAATQESAMADARGCHDMAGHQADSQPVPMSHGKAACCQGSVCNCACVLPVPAGLPLLRLLGFWPSQPALMAVDRYLSVDASLILRPPIA